MVDPDQGNLGAKVFFVWGAACLFSLVFAYFCVSETKGEPFNLIISILAD